ncbi:MAG TPA: hypothetical protein VGK21_10125 [Candidatus Angelobacter sp.]|jgi:hypothetical protein
MEEDSPEIKKLERSTVEFYIGLAIAIITVVFPMTWWLRCLLLLILVFIALHVSYRHPRIANKHVALRTVLGVLVVILIISIAWKPIRQEYKEETKTVEPRIAVLPSPTPTAIPTPVSTPTKSAPKAPSRVRPLPVPTSIPAIAQPPVIGLDAAKGKALDLAEEIQSFYDRRVEARQIVMQAMNAQAIRTGSNEELEKRRKDFDDTSLMFFAETFAARIEESIAELKVRGAYVKPAEMSCRHLNIYMGIADCSKSIAKAANELQPGAVPPTIPANIQLTQNIQARSPDPEYPFASLLEMRTDRTILHVAFIVTYDHVPDKVEPQNYGASRKEQIGFRHMLYPGNQVGYEWDAPSFRPDNPIFMQILDKTQQSKVTGFRWVERIYPEF